MNRVIKDVPLFEDLEKGLRRDENELLFEVKPNDNNTFSTIENTFYEMILLMKNHLGSFFQSSE